MESKKEQRCAVYKTKAIHEQRQKAERLTGKNSEELASIQNMDEMDLIHLLNNKYDKIISKNQEIYLPLNNAISQRIPNIRNEAVAKAKSELRAFLAKGEAELTEQQETSLFNDGHFSNDRNNTKMSGVRIVIRPQNDIRMIDVAIRAYSPAEESKSLFCGKIPADCYTEIDMKRFKKDALQILEAIAAFKANVFQMSGQRL
jgi:hypothetical protein